VKKLIGWGIALVLAVIFSSGTYYYLKSDSYIADFSRPLPKDENCGSFSYVYLRRNEFPEPLKDLILKERFYDFEIFSGKSQFSYYLRHLQCIKRGWGRVDWDCRWPLDRFMRSYFKRYFSDKYETHFIGFYLATYIATARLYSAIDQDLLIEKLLNTVEGGKKQGCPLIGLEMISRGKLNKSVKDLKLEEMTYLAAITTAPLPDRLEYVERHQKFILSHLIEENKITKFEAKKVLTRFFPKARLDD
jgi:hypothetical protein